MDRPGNGPATPRKKVSEPCPTVGRMEQRLNFVTLAVANVERSLAFYADGLGWQPAFHVPDEVAFVPVADEVVLSLWSRAGFSDEVGEPGSGTPPVTLAHNVSSPAEVDEVLTTAGSAGAAVRPGVHRDWGGYSGYFTDPDGFWWEVAHNPTPLGEALVTASRARVARTDLTPARVLAEVGVREPVFHREPVGADRAHFEAMTTPDFFEVGASGSAYARDQVCELMAQRYATGERDGDDAWVVSDLGARELGPGVWQLSYALDQAGRRTRRSTIWVVGPGGWRAAHHQGTITG